MAPMKTAMFLSRPIVRTFRIWSPVILLACGICAGNAAPSIEITNVPAFGSFDNLGGRVVGVSPAAYSVAVFIYVPGPGWYSKPYCSPQITALQPDTSGTADITTGGSDQYATRVTALLVGTNYSQPCVQGPAA